jgi:predicted transposase/invertase (TIGR01784 family)
MNDDILPPSDDHIFKTLLTHPEAKPALIDLLSAVTGRNVTDAQIRNNELPASDIEEKAERLDVNCVVDGKDQVNVEMHASRLSEPAEGHINFINKYIYDLTDLHSSQKSKGVRYIDLARTYQVTFSTYTIFPHRRDSLRFLVCVPQTGN